jgi:hypothetical protein
LKYIGTPVVVATVSANNTNGSALCSALGAAGPSATGGKSSGGVIELRLLS